MPAAIAAKSRAVKRIVVCCDGTWVNSLGKGHDPPTNVTRIARAISRTCSDGTHQVISYHRGVGTGDTMLERVTGGAFGMGLDSDIREVYNFICGNYVDGDEIILIGFSRGAFTSRSTADMIASMGLLTPEGLDHFYDIFSDYENLGDEKRSKSDYLCPELDPFDSKMTGNAKMDWIAKRKTDYRTWLKKKKWTRDMYKDGTEEKEITIKALGVWDTVGTLGIPPAPVIGIQGSAKQWKFTDTHVSHKVENAFQALALDEPRTAFLPCLWERLDDNQTTNLKQVWFPGNHGGVGGGWYDQQISDICLAWMCDQLSTVGVEFSTTRLTNIFEASLAYSAAHPYPFVPTSAWNPANWLGPPAAKPWANPDICAIFDPKQRADGTDCQHVEHPSAAAAGAKAAAAATPRPWGLGQTRYPNSKAQVAAGTTTRRPGLFLRADEAATRNTLTAEPLANTNERVHSCVRVRLACGGLAVDDAAAWTCAALTTADDGSPLWRLQHRAAPPTALTANAAAAAQRHASGPPELSLSAEDYPRDGLYSTRETDGQWSWVYVGKGKKPYSSVLPEEPMVGYWEKRLLALTTGEKDVWRWAESNHPGRWMHQE